MEVLLGAKIKGAAGNIGKNRVNLLEKISKIKNFGVLIFWNVNILESKFPGIRYLRTFGSIAERIFTAHTRFTSYTNHLYCFIK